TFPIAGSRAPVRRNRSHPRPSRAALWPNVQLTRRLTRARQGSSTNLQSRDRSGAATRSVESLLEGIDGDPTASQASGQLRTVRREGHGVLRIRPRASRVEIFPVDRRNSVFLESFRGDHDSAALYPGRDVPQLDLALRRDHRQLLAVV